MYSCAREAHQHSGVRARGAPTHHLELGNFGARLGVCACLQPRAGTTDFSRAARARRRGQHAAKRGSAEGDQRAHVRDGTGASLTWGELIGRQTAKISVANWLQPSPDTHMSTMPNQTLLTRARQQRVAWIEQVSDERARSGGFSNVGLFQPRVLPTSA